METMLLLVAVYVDDLHIVEKSKEEVLKFIAKLQQFPGKHLMPLEHFLGIHVKRIEP